MSTPYSAERNLSVGKNAVTWDSASLFLSEKAEAILQYVEVQPEFFSLHWVSRIGSLLLDHLKASHSSD